MESEAAEETSWAQTPSFWITTQRLGKTDRAQLRHLLIVVDLGRRDWPTLLFCQSNFIINGKTPANLGELHPVLLMRWTDKIA